MFDRLIELTFLEWIFLPSCSEFPVSVCPCLVWEVSHMRLLNSHITSKEKSCFCRLASRGVLSEKFWGPGDSWTEDLLPWDQRVIQVGKSFRGGLQFSFLHGSAPRSDRVAPGFVLLELENSMDGNCTTYSAKLSSSGFFLFKVSYPQESSPFSVQFIACCPACTSLKSLSVHLPSLWHRVFLHVLDKDIE